jgi:hypothetical protein
MRAHAVLCCACFFSFRSWAGLLHRHTLVATAAAHRKALCQFMRAMAAAADEQKQRKRPPTRQSTMSVSANGVEHAGSIRNVRDSKYMLNSSNSSSKTAVLYRKVCPILLATLCYYAAARLGLMITLDRLSLFW